jgi:hypothetical protein
MKFGVALTTRGRDATGETLARVSRALERFAVEIRPAASDLP